jgi:hypothetical protein
LGRDWYRPKKPEGYAVLDTSVLVAGLRSKNGASFQILRAIRRGNIRIAVSVALVPEYEAATLRSGPLPTSRREEIGKIIDGLCQLADHQQVFFARKRFLSDPGDDLFLELAAPFVIMHSIPTLWLSATHPPQAFRRRRAISRTTARPSNEADAGSGTGVNAMVTLPFNVASISAPLMAEFGELPRLSRMDWPSASS